MTAVTTPAMSAEIVVVKVTSVALVVFKKLCAEPSSGQRSQATSTSTSIPLPAAIAESEGAPHGQL